MKLTSVLVQNPNGFAFLSQLEMIFPGIPVPDFPGIRRFLMREFSREFFLNSREFRENFAKSLRPKRTKIMSFHRVISLYKL